MATGNIIVIEPEDGFKRIHKSIIRNKNIDCLTLGIYTKITVLGAEWQLNVKGLSSALYLSDTKIRKSLGILEKEGYIVRKPIRGDKGQMQGWDYIVFPTPIDEKERSKAGYPKIPFDEQEQFVAENETNRLPQKPTTRLTDNTESGEDYNNRPNITIDLNNNKTNKDKKEIKEKSDVDLSFVSDDFLPIVQDWLAYKKEKKQTYKQRGAKMFYSQLVNLSNNDSEVARLIIEQSMANNWAGIFALRNNHNANKFKQNNQCQKDDSVTIGGQTYK